MLGVNEERFALETLRMAEWDVEEVGENFSGWQKMSVMEFASMLVWER